MQFLNKANGFQGDHLTAKEIAYLYVEGVDIWATPKVWRRVQKRIRLMGIVPGDPVLMEPMSHLEVQVAITEADKWASEQIDSFLEDMYIMGMLEEEEEDE